MKTLDIIKRQNIERTHNAFSLKKKKFCKFTKGSHDFVLVIPKHLKGFGRFKGLNTVEEFYYEYNGKDTGFRKDTDIFHFECKHCGKQDMVMKKKS